MTMEDADEIRLSSRIEEGPCPSFLNVPFMARIPFGQDLDCSVSRYQATCNTSLPDSRIVQRLREDAE